MKLSVLKKFRGRRLPIWGDIPYRTRVVVLGAAITVAVLVMEAAGALRPLEGWLYDTRARRCQFFSPPPTTQVVHLDIDDSALEAYGKWPWRRGRRIVGRVVDELRDAGAKALALDITFVDEDASPEQDYEDETPGPTTSPTLPTTTPASVASGTDTYPVSTPPAPTPPPTTAPTRSATAAMEALRREDEAALASAVERFGKVVLPTDFEIRLDRESELERVVREQLRLNLELTPDEMADWLKRFGGRKLRNVSRDDLIDALMAGRKQVLLEKLMVAPNQPVEDLLPREMRGGMVRAVRSPLQELVEKKRAQARSVLAMERLYSREVPSDLADLLVTRSQAPPIESLTAALARAKAAGGAGIIGSVNDAQAALSPDGVVRAVPLLVNDRGRLLPQFGLALACTVLGVDPTNREEFTVSADQIVLSPPGAQPITIPIYDEPAHGRVPAVGACFAIPWFGGHDWRTMYDWPRQAEIVNHIPFTLAATIGKKRADLRLNERNRDLAHEDIAMLRRLGDLPPEDPTKPFPAVLDETLKAAEFRVNDLRKIPPSERQPDEVLMLRVADAVARLKANDDALRAELDEATTKLRRAVQGKVVIVGWTASGQSADSVPTSLHGSCPGAVVHGVIFNAIVTRNMWSRAPDWLPYLIAALFGALMTLAVAKLTPWASTAVAVALALAYAAFNGLLLFDRFNVILGAAAPLSAIGLVWAGCTAASAGERFRINQLLHGYVDPKLVDYLNQHPENELFKTKTQEITVCFSDIQGFTTLTQQLGERMIPLLQDYLSRMVVVIRRHDGLVNKFMGDGIMFLFGVPDRMGTAQHARAALLCCLEMQEALEKFNQEHVPQGFPALAMRVGVNTGVAYVGDAGPEDAREYTALGDTTNLAARLEPANKAFETRILVTETTYLQTLNSFVFVPVGKLQVRGRREGTMTYELLCRADDADETCRQRAEAMRAVILSYQQGVFDGCLKLLDSIESKFGTTPACAIYRDLCQKYLTDGPPPDFHGQVRIG